MRSSRTRPWPDPVPDDETLVSTDHASLGLMACPLGRHAQHAPRRHPRTSPTALALAVMLALEVGLTGARATGVDRLPPLDRRFYEVLASDTDRRISSTKPAERQSFLESRGLWDAWQSLTAEERTAVESGTIEVGYLQFVAHMAWYVRG